MKKKLFLASAILLVFINVKAEESYKIVDYTSEKGENTKLIKYIPITINRFYKYGETNIVYADSDLYIEESPFIDYDTIIENINYTTERTENDAQHHLNIIGEHNVVRSLRLNDFKSNGSKNYIKEIEVYYQGKIISYSTYTYIWLCDTFLKEGEIINNGSVYLKFFEDYDLNQLEIKIYYSNNSGIAPSFTLYYQDINTNETFYKSIALDNKIKDNNITTINFLDQDDYNDILFKNNLYEKCNNNDPYLCSYYIEIKQWYKHYQIGKLYYIDSPLNSLEGYIFNKDESYTIYAVLKINENLTNKDLNNTFDKENNIADTKEDDLISFDPNEKKLEIISKKPKNEQKDMITKNETSVIDGENIKKDGYLESYNQINYKNSQMFDNSLKLDSKEQNQNIPYIAYTNNTKLKQEDKNKDTSKDLTKQLLLILKIIFIFIIFLSVIHCLRKILHKNYE